MNRGVPAPAGPRQALAPRLALALGIAAVSCGSLFVRFAQADAPSQALRGVGLSVGAVIQAFWTVMAQKAPTCSKFVTGSPAAAAQCGIESVAWVQSKAMTRS